MFEQGIGDMVYVRNAKKHKFPKGIEWGWVQGWTFVKGTGLRLEPGVGLAPEAGSKVSVVTVAIPDPKDAYQVHFGAKTVEVPIKDIVDLDLGSGRYARPNEIKRALRKVKVKFESFNNSSTRERESIMVLQELKSILNEIKGSSEFKRAVMVLKDGRTLQIQGNDKGVSISDEEEGVGYTLGQMAKFFGMEKQELQKILDSAVRNSRNDQAFAKILSNVFSKVKVKTIRAGVE